jgi:hypothetical protein
MGQINLARSFPGYAAPAVMPQQTSHAPHTAARKRAREQGKIIVTAPHRGRPLATGRGRHGDEMASSIEGDKAASPSQANNAVGGTGGHAQTANATIPARSIRRIRVGSVCEPFAEQRP